MSRKSIIIAIAVVIGGILIYSATYTVGEANQVILTRFGKISGAPVTEPGLHFKAPFLDEVHRLDKRWLAWDGAPQRMPTGDKKYIWVDAFARWRIKDPVLYYKRLGNQLRALSRLGDVIKNEVKKAIASHNLIEVVRWKSRVFQTDLTDDQAPVTPTSRPVENADAKQKKVAARTARQAGFQAKHGRQALVTMALEKARPVLMKQYGIELADIQIKRVNYSQSVQKKVFERMISERKRIASRYRSEGKATKAHIMGQTEKELKKIESEAYRKSQEIRGKADAAAAAIYANAYNDAPDLYRFLKTLETYRKTIDKETMVLLSTDAEFLRYLKSSK